MGPSSYRTRQEYARRINAALDLIDQDLSSQIPLARLARAAAFSPFHFHRIFTALVGETPADHVRRRRLEKAASLLRFDRQSTVTQIALACGISTSALFCRLFKQRFGMSPTAWRRRYEKSKNRQPKSKNRKDAASRVRSHWVMKRRGGRLPSVTVKDVAAFRVAFVPVRTGYDDSESIGKAFQKVFAWAGPRGVISPEMRVMGISWDDPEITPRDRCRYYACVSVTDRARPGGEVGAESAEHVGVLDVRPGAYAVGRFSGGAGVFKRAYAYMYGEWLPRSGLQPDDAPAFESYVGEPRPGRFAFDLYIPVRPL